ncbi:GntR family transcriptional regulator [Paraburkholderia sp. CNPSo 3157]|uniref:GntR family transcriptional regulator n=1 Tax=Paraburkholderia franconis TaxID=2654983 RepID=A0A7X1N8U1_9BURK|nr:FCD domain-containing protein [Paraburkholderia franconis]MPW17410.1 GntR family transcriptional regulator [Paraburkholderia franconis]
MNHTHESSLVKRVVNELVGSIVDGTYNGNLLPPQTELSKKHGVSRTVMREALSVLISRRMLDVRPKRGTQITPAKDWLIIDPEIVEWRLRAAPDREFLDGLIELRKLVDPRAAWLAAIRATEYERCVIDAAYHHLLDASSKGDAVQTAGEILHMSILEASADQFILEMGAIIRAGFRAMAPDAYITNNAVDMVIDYYGKIVTAIDAHAGDEAKSLMTLLLTDIAEGIAR